MSNLLGTVGVISLAALLAFVYRRNLGSSEHVVIVGGGLAGMSAAIEAVNHGATSVTIVEKEKNLGGNSAKATSGMNAANSMVQIDQAVADSVEDFVSDTIKSGGGKSNENLVSVLASRSADAIAWLKSEPFNLGIDALVQLGGHSRKRTHRFPPRPDGKPTPVGFTVTAALRKHIEDKLKDKIKVMTNARLTDVLFEGEGAQRRVTGVAYELPFMGNDRHELAADAVVLTAGGFAFDKAGGTDKSSLLNEVAPQVAHLPTTNGAWATGDIIRIAQKNDVKLVHLDQVQVHPTGFVEPSDPTAHTTFLAPEALRGVGGILLNHKGGRFVNELYRRDQVTAAIFQHCQPFGGGEGGPVSARLLMTDEMVQKFGGGAAGFYKFKKLMVDYSSLDEVAAAMDVDASVLQKTVADYDSAADGKLKDAFGKTVFPAKFAGAAKLTLAYVTPSLHYCMGGLAFDSDAGVLSTDDTKIRGLYAAGEVTGGLHGANRLGGNSLLECVVFGRIAGKNSAHFVTSGGS